MTEQEDGRNRGWGGRRDGVTWFCGGEEDAMGGGRGLTRCLPVVLVSTVLQHLHAARAPQRVQQHVVQRILTILQEQQEDRWVVHIIYDGAASVSWNLIMMMTN